MQRRLCLISLSNYVFVLEISGISGMVHNVRMLIRVVMRNVARQRLLINLLKFPITCAKRAVYMLQVMSVCSTGGGNGRRTM